MWDKDSFGVKAKNEGTRWSILIGTFVQQNWCGGIGLVYISCDELDRRDIYLKINSVIQSLDCPYIVLGDFNEILNLKQKRGQTSITSCMTDFKV